jgi:hypothetical protein
MLPPNKPTVIYSRFTNNTSQPLLNYCAVRKFENGIWSLMGGNVSGTGTNYYLSTVLAQNGNLFASYANTTTAVSFVKQFIGAIIPCTTNTWAGTVSTAWEDPVNWSCGIVSDLNTTVIINAGLTNYPLISSNATCKMITVSSSANITIKTGFNLTITGK